MATCWLYIYENVAWNSVYIGIADSMDRVFQPHNPAAEALRDASGSTILQTLEPFSTRRDARKAEAIAIHIAAMAGMKVHGEDDSGHPLVSTNIAGVHSTKELGPAIFTREGVVPWNSLTGTVMVPISADQLDGRPAPFGGHGGAFFADRAQRHWNVAWWKRPRITRLLAVLKGGRGLILGDWDVASDAEWAQAWEGSSRIAIPLVDPEIDDPRGVKGMRLEGHRLNSGVTYSPDLR